MIVRSPFVNKLHLIPLFANLGGSLQSLGDYKRAGEIQATALETSIKYQGLEHPETRTLMLNLGNAARSLFDYERSHTLTKEAWELYKKHDGEDHPDTVNAAMAYASTLMHLKGRIPESEELLRGCFAKQSRIFGPEHPRTLVTATNLYLVLLRQSLSERAGPIKGFSEKLKEGMELNKTTYQCKVRVLGYSNISSLLSGKHYGTHLVASCHRGGNLMASCQKQLKEAVGILGEVYKILVRVHGVEHAHTLNTAKSLVDCKFKFSELVLLESGIEAAERVQADAWGLGEETLARYMKVYGPEFAEMQEMNVVLKMQRMMDDLEKDLMAIPPCPGCDDPNCKSNRPKVDSPPEPCTGCNDNPYCPNYLGPEAQ